MEVNVGNQSCVHWSMQLAKYVRTKRAGRDVLHCTHVLLTQYADHLCNNAMKRQYTDLSSASCNVVAVERTVSPDGFFLRQFTSVMIAGRNRSVAHANKSSKRSQVQDRRQGEAAIGNGHTKRHNNVQ